MKYLKNKNSTKEILKEIIAYIFQNQWQTTNTKQNKCKHTHTKSTYTPKHIILKENKDKEKIFKAARGKWNTLPTEEEGYELQQTSHQKLCKQENNRVTSLSVERKNMSTHNSASSEISIVLESEGKQRLSQTNINWLNLLTAKIPYKNVKRRSPSRRNIIKIRNLSLHQETKSIGNGVNEGIMFLISLKDNWMLKY